MFGLKHAFRVLHNAVREKAKSGSKLAQKLTGEPPRSDKWPKVEHQYLDLHPKCQACNGILHLNVHHKIAFAHNPSLELDLGNLITLCMGPLECHIRIGHGDNFQYYNPNVELDAATVLARPDQRGAVEAKAKAARIKST